MDSHKIKLSKQWFIESHVGNIKDVYHFIERLGAGGFGVVYLAEDRATGAFPLDLAYYDLPTDIFIRLN